MKTSPNKTQTPIRVGIRGITGMLGRRLALNIEANTDMQVTFGVVKKDKTLVHLASIIGAISKESRARLTDNLYMEENQRVVHEVNTSSPETFKPLDQLPSLGKLCDVFVDATRRSSNIENVFNARYPSFHGVVLLQSGEYPRGRLISPPVVVPEDDKSKSESNVYRQGDCILSGTVPVLAAIVPIVNRVRLSVVMQLDESLNTFPTQQNVVAMYPRPDVADMVETQLGRLFPNRGIEVDSVTQIPSHDYYTATIRAVAPAHVDHENIREILKTVPRVRIAHGHIRSTADLDQAFREPANMLGRQVSPIIAYDVFFETKRQAGENVIRIQLAIYSRLAAILPNIDSIRYLGSKISMLEAMRLTDINLKL